MAWGRGGVRAGRGGLNPAAGERREQLLPARPGPARPPRVSPLAAAPPGPVRLVWAAPPGSVLGGAAAGRSDRPSLGTPKGPDPRAAGAPPGWGATGSITTGSTVGSPTCAGRAAGGRRERGAPPGAPPLPPITCCTPRPRGPGEPLSAPSTSPNLEGPSLKPAPQFSGGVPPGTLPSPPGAPVAPVPARSPGVASGRQIRSPALPAPAALPGARARPDPEAGRGRSAGSLTFLPGTQDPPGACEGGRAPRSSGRTRLTSLICRNSAEVRPHLQRTHLQPVRAPGSCGGQAGVR